MSRRKDVGDEGLLESVKSDHEAEEDEWECSNYGGVVVKAAAESCFESGKSKFSLFIEQSR
jgi:hypothetical protein